MFRSVILAAAAVAAVGTPLLVFQAGPANAEPTRLVTSDGAGQPYLDGRKMERSHWLWEARRDRERQRQFLGSQNIKMTNH
jgi:hypothetical protein